MENRILISFAYLLGLRPGTLVWPYLETTRDGAGEGSLKIQDPPEAKTKQLKSPVSLIRFASLRAPRPTTLAGCFAHVRRGFFEALEQAPKHLNRRDRPPLQPREKGAAPGRSELPYARPIGPGRVG
jgi:hypothetical protein